jgi:hypothetical protein
MGDPSVEWTLTLSPDRIKTVLLIYSLLCTNQQNSSPSVGRSGHEANNRDRLGIALIPALPKS